MPLVVLKSEEPDHGLVLAGTKNAGIQDAMGERTFGCLDTDQG